MTILHSLSDWLAFKQATTPSIATLPVVKMGDDGDLSPPFLGLMESGSSMHETAGVNMRGVTDYEVTVELHTIPTDEEEEGTEPETERTIRNAIYGVLGDQSAIAWMEDRNGWRVFDIRIAAPTTEAGDGRRISRWNLTIVACPT